jgi:hypothetical protein
MSYKSCQSFRTKDGLNAVSEISGCDTAAIARKTLAERGRGRRRKKGGNEQYANHPTSCRGGRQNAQRRLPYKQNMKGRTDSAFQAAG